MAKEPQDISLRDIVDAMEGPVELGECTQSEHSCEKSCNCPVRWVWKRVTDTINDEREKIKLSDMLKSTCEGKD